MFRGTLPEVVGLPSATASMTNGLSDDETCNSATCGVSYVPYSCTMQNNGLSINIHLPTVFKVLFPTTPATYH